MPQTNHAPWWCHVISHISLIYFIISSFLPVILLPPLLSFTLFGVLWIFMVATGVQTLPLSLKEWVETRYLYIIACIKHQLYGPDPSTSGFLLLPPEIRLRIWEKLIPRTRCVRGDTRITVDWMGIHENYSDGSPWECCRRRVGLPPRYRIRTSPRIPVEFLRTCRLNYEEGNHFLYSTSTFEFTGHQALYYFVNTRSLSQQGSIRHLIVGASSVYECGWWFDVPALHAFEVPSIIKKLRNLQTLDIEHDVDDARDKEVAESDAQLISAHVRRFRVWEAVIVKLYLFGRHYETRLDAKMQGEQECHCQEALEKAGWALIREPESSFPLPAAQREPIFHGKYVLQAPTPA